MGQDPKKGLQQTQLKTTEARLKSKNEKEKSKSTQIDLVLPRTNVERGKMTELALGLPRSNDAESEEGKYCMPMYKAITEACGEKEATHLPNCNEKNCWVKTEKDLEKLDDEDEDFDMPYFRAAMVPENVRRIKLGRLLCQILRFRAQSLSIQINKNGYVPMIQLIKHPVMEGYNVDEIVQLVKSDDKKRYKIVRDKDDDLHIRAQSGHGSFTNVRIQHKELKEEDLPPKVAHVTLIRNIKYILNDGLSPGRRQHVHLYREIPKVGEPIEGSRSGSTAVVIIDVAFAIKMGVKFYSSENEVLLANHSGGKSRFDAIPATAICEVRKHPSGEVIYPAQNGKSALLEQPRYRYEPDEPTFQKNRSQNT